MMSGNLIPLFAADDTDFAKSNLPLESLIDNKFLLRDTLRRPFKDFQGNDDGTGGGLKERGRDDRELMLEDRIPSPNQPSGQCQ